MMLCSIAISVFLICHFLLATGYHLPLQVVDRGMTSRYGGQLQTKQTLSV